MKMKVTPLEWEIMKGIWDLQDRKTERISVRCVLEDLYPEGEKAYTTVQTIMNKLLDKGYLAKEKIGLVNFYQPTKKREELLGGETSRFVDKIFNGSFGELAMYLVGSGQLSSEEQDDLRSLLEGKE